jgi:tRNA/tmRNA/rRNA uracil-C5-methylase (TrmA/RlmC/RlmD family)
LQRVFVSSFNDEVTPNELQKILRNVEGTIARLEKRVSESHKKKPASKTAKAVMVRDVTPEDTLDDEAVIDTWKGLKGQRYVDTNASYQTYSIFLYFEVGGQSYRSILPKKNETQYITKEIVYIKKEL